MQLTKFIIVLSIFFMVGCGDSATKEKITVEEDSKSVSTVDNNTVLDDLESTSTLEDTTAPIITLKGESNLTITQGSSYIEYGATASDERDGDITADIVIGNLVDSYTLGSYTVTYDVNDSAGNRAEQVIRTVTVISGSSSGGSTTIASSNSSITTKTAVLYDSIVIGARYDAGSGITGTTDANGTFRYIEGQAIKFYIGDVFIGEGHPVDKPAGISVVTDKILTPLGLASSGDNIDDPQALKIIRFLMGLDGDGNPDNGIDIDIDKVSGQTLTLLDAQVDLDVLFGQQPHTPLVC